MNQLGRDALRAAALAGVPQIKNGHIEDGAGRCAWGVLSDAGLYSVEEQMRATKVTGCHLCGAKMHTLTLNKDWEIDEEISLLCHLNNDHGLDFIGCAEKMPVSDTEGGRG